MANFIKDDLAKVGIRCTPAPVDFNTLITNLRQDFQYEADAARAPVGRAARSRHGRRTSGARAGSRTTGTSSSRGPRRRPRRGSTADATSVCDHRHGRAQARLERDPERCQRAVRSSSGCPAQNVKVPVRNRFGNVQPDRDPASHPVEHRPGVREGASRLSGPERAARCAPTSCGGCCRSIPLLLGISALTFLLLQLAPGDFLNTDGRESRDLGRDARGDAPALRPRPAVVRPVRPLPQEHLFLRFDFGESFSRHQPVFVVLREGLGNTLLLAVAAAIVTWGLAIPLGVVAAVRQYSWVDKALSFVAFVVALGPRGAVGAPAAAARGARPAGSRSAACGRSTGRSSTAIGQDRSTSCTTSRCRRSWSGSIPLASRMRQMRGNLLDVLRLDYVTTARAKGLAENVGGLQARAAERDQPADHAVRLHPRRAASRARSSPRSSSPGPGSGSITLDAILRAGPVPRDGLGADGVDGARRSATWSPTCCSPSPIPGSL